MTKGASRMRVDIKGNASWAPHSPSPGRFRIGRYLAVVEHHAVAT